MCRFAPRRPLRRPPLPATTPAAGPVDLDGGLDGLVGEDGAARAGLGQHRRVPVELDVRVGQHDGPRQGQPLGTVELLGDLDQHRGQAGGVGPVLGLDRPRRLQDRLEDPEAPADGDGLGQAGHEGADGGVHRKGDLAGDRFDQDEGQRVDVAAPGQGSALGLLGRGVAGGAQHGARGLGHGGVGQGPSQAEVGDAQALVLAEEEVGRLQVPVHEALAVGVVQALRRLEADERGLGDAQPLALVEHGPQGAAPDELGDQERDLVLTPVVDGEEVRMVETGRGLGLGAEAADEGLVAGVGLVQELDGHPALQPGVLGQEDLGRGPGPDGRQEPVPTREDPTDLVVQAGHGHGPEGKGWARRHRGASR